MNTLKNILNRIKNFALRHKFWTIGGVLVLAVAAFFIFRPSAPAQFEYMTIEAATLTTSVEGSGSVSTESQVELKSTVSGKITDVMVSSGQTVKQGQPLVRVDGTEAWQALQRANLNLEKSLLALSKARTTANLDEEKTENTLEEAYTTGRNTLTSAYTDVENVLVGIDDLFSGYLSTTEHALEYSSNSKERIDLAEDSYWAAERFRKEAIKNYRLIGADSSREDIRDALDEAEELARLTAQAAKDARDTVSYVRERDDTNLTEADEAWDTITTLADTSATALEEVTIAVQAIEESGLDLEDIESGSNDLDIQTQELDVRDKEQAVAEAQTELAKYTITAPFAGTVGSIEAVRYDWLANNTTVATLSTDNSIAEISLNEVDVTNIRIGQKTELTFDALPDLTLTGTVSEIDSVGVETSNVVTFNVKIVFDEEDERIRPGMGVTANVITSEKKNVLLVPNGSIKNENGQNYVEVRNLSTGTNDRVNVTLGESNDTDTEITAGLTAGQEVVVREIIDTPASTGGGFGPPGA